MKKRFAALLGMLLFLGLFVQAQTRSITGTVTSSQDGLGIPGVSVLVKGTTTGTTTNLDGKYTLNVPADAVTLVFSFVGMKTQEIGIGGRAIIDAILELETTELEEVMVVAYGTAKKASFTGSTAQVSGEKIKARPITNVTKALEGTAPGVQVNSGTGQPGASLDIRIRGVGSVNASNDPLYVVDGVPYTGSIGNISSNDIESLSVLKDAGSTALYGNKAANGVVMITTKKGNRDSNQINFRMTKGVSSRSLPEYEKVNAYEYYPLLWEAYRNSLAYSSTVPLLVANDLATGINYPRNASNKQIYGTSTYFDISQNLGYNPFNVGSTEIVDNTGKINPNAKLLYGNDLDWFGPMLRAGGRDEYSLTYNGGSKTNDYYFSLGYLNEKGFQIKTDYKRYTARVNVNTQPKKWIKGGINVSTTITESNQSAADGGTSYVNPFFFSRGMGPIYPVYAHDPITGDFILDNAGNKIYDLGNMTTLGLPSRPAGASPGRHSIAETNYNDNLFKRNALSGRTYVDISFLDGFKFTTNVSADISNYNAASYDNKIVGDGAPAGRADRENQLTTTVNLNQLLNYNKAFGKHSVEALVGHESNNMIFNDLYGFRQGIIAEGNTELINFTTTNDLSSYTDKETSEGYFSRLNYNFDNKYFVSGSYRRDGSSRFAKDNRWGNFYSFGLAWRVDQEEFIKNMTWIDMLKVRASYGELGNNRGIGYYTYQALYGLGNNNAAEPGYLQTQLANDKLTWESNATYDIGIEFDLFKRINGSIEYFNRKSSNLLFSVPLPLSSGMQTQMQNVGAMLNKGIEIRIAGDVVKMQDFKWNIDANITSFKNEMTKLPTGQTEIISGTKKLMVGHSMYDYWLRDWYGVDPTDGAALYNSAVVSGTNTKIVDANTRYIGNDTLTISQNNAMYHYAGSSIPDFYGGVTNAFSYKNFQLSVVFMYQIGGSTYDGIYAGLMHSGNYGAALSKDALLRWQNPGDNTTVPRMDNAKQSAYGAASDRWLISSSYLALKSINFSYNLPSKWAQKVALKNATLYVSAENLWMKSKRTGMNPMQGFDGLTSNIYTPSKIITFGINVTL